MSTIDNLLRYNLTESEIKALYECGICNWIDGKIDTETLVNLSYLIK